MTSTAATAPGPGDLRDLDVAGALWFVVDRRRAADRAEADLLAGVVHWVDLHPVTDRHPAAQLDPGHRTHHPR
jgi:hypothetical protein